MPLYSTRGAASAKAFGFAGAGLTYIEATGGTVTTSGDFKVHKFTTGGSFVVSKISKEPAASGFGVRYLVVAGGGGGGGTNSRGGSFFCIIYQYYWWWWRRIYKWS
jgi:hypothetical protein